MKTSRTLHQTSALILDTRKLYFYLSLLSQYTTFFYFLKRVPQHPALFFIINICPFLQWRVTFFFLRKENDYEDIKNEKWNAWSKDCLLCYKTPTNVFLPLKWKKNYGIEIEEKEQLLKRMDGVETDAKKCEKYNYEIWLLPYSKNFNSIFT